MSTDRIEALVQKVQALSDAGARAAALDLVQAVMDFHAVGLERMMEVLAEAETGGGVLEAVASDPVASSILLLHDLHPLSLPDRVERAIGRSEFQVRGTRVSLLSIDDGVVRVHVEGPPALRTAVEMAVSEAAPDAVDLVVEGAPSGAFVPVEQLLAGSV